MLQTHQLHDPQTPSKNLDEDYERKPERGFKKLNELEQRVFQLRVYREYSYQLIAEEMDIKVVM